MIRQTKLILLTALFMIALGSASGIPITRADCSGYVVQLAACWLGG